MHNIVNKLDNEFEGTACTNYLLSEHAHERKYPKEMVRSSHLDIAVDDLGSKPMINVSIGTKIPPPPTPPTLPNDAPKNPINVPSTTFHPNSIGCITSTKFTKLALRIHKHYIEQTYKKKNCTPSETTNMDQRD